MASRGHIEGAADGIKGAADGIEGAADGSEGAADGLVGAAEPEDVDFCGTGRRELRVRERPRRDGLRRRRGRLEDEGEELDEVEPLQGCSQTVCATAFLKSGF